MPLAERDTELETLTGLHLDCLEKRGRVVLVSGAIGTGKTELLHTFASLIRESGTLFLGATCVVAEQNLPLGVMRQLFRGALPGRDSPDDTTARVNRIIEAGAAATNGPSTGNSQQSVATHVVQNICRAILDLADHVPVLIGIDDIDHADLASLQCLLYLARRLRSVRVVVVLNECAGPPSLHPGFRGELLGQSHIGRIRLATLSVEGVAALLAAHFDAGAARELAAACHTISGGNPILINALLEDHYAPVPHRAGTPLTPGETLCHAVEALVVRCAPTQRQVIRALAVLGRPTRASLVARLLDVDTEAISESLVALSAMGLLLVDPPTEGRFRHPAVRAAVLRGMLAPDREVLHRRAASVLHHAGAAATAVATHLVAIDDANMPWAVPVLRTAAQQALADDQVELAVKCLTLAQRHCADDRQRGAIITMLARAHWRVDPGTVLQYTTHLTTALHAGEGWPHHAVSLVRYLLWHGQTEDAYDTLYLLDRATRSGTDQRKPNPETVAELHITRLLVSSSFPTVLPALSAPQEQTDPEYVQPAAVTLRLHAAAGLLSVLTNGIDEATLDSAEWVLESTQFHDATLEPVMVALLTLVYADRLDKAEPWCDALLAEARSRGAVTWHAIFEAIRAEIAVRQEDFQRAADHARSALGRLSAQSWGTAIGAPIATLILAMVAMGDREEAAKQLGRSVPEALFTSRHGLHYLYARGRYHLACDRMHAALGDFETCGRLMRRWHLDAPSLVPWRTGMAETYLRLGKPDLARSLVSEQLARSGPILSGAYGMSPRLRAAISEQPPQPQSQQQHLLRCDNSDSRTILCNRGETPRILSPSERRVAELAARGHTNREIANTLFITVSTVEQHLTRVYRKLRVKRQDLISGSPIREPHPTAQHTGA